MESQELRIFREVARAGSISKAAGQLGYVQSNVTARIKKLDRSGSYAVDIQTAAVADRISGTASGNESLCGHGQSGSSGPISVRR